MDAPRPKQALQVNDLLLQDFETASRAVLALLRKRFGFKLWMVTRTEGDDWIVLQAEDNGYGVKPGAVFRWADSFCSEMVKGNGPRIAPNSDQVPIYAEAPIGRQVPIKAYIGIPLHRSGGGLFGTLCAIDPSPQPESLLHEQDLLELLAAMLSTILQLELLAATEARRCQRLQEEAEIDALTGLYNRRAWDRMLDREEDRCRRYGHPAAVMVIDLDELKHINDTAGHGAGDALLKRTAEALSQATRNLDVVARLGGDEFGIIAAECAAAGAQALLQRLRHTLENAGVKASIGLALRTPSAGLGSAWEEADRLMYQEKRAR